MSAVTAVSCLTDDTYPTTEDSEFNTVGNADVLCELLKGANGGWSPLGSTNCNDDDGRATITTASNADGMSPASMLSGVHTASWTSIHGDNSIRMPSIFTETLQSDTSIDFGSPSTASNVMSFAKTVDKHFAKIYERRIQAMVKEEQRKSLKRAA